MDTLFLDSFGTWKTLFVMQQNFQSTVTRDPPANGTKWYGAPLAHRQARSLSLSRLSPGATLRPTTPTYGGGRLSLLESVPAFLAA